jgi:hypothetical protein
LAVAHLGVPLQIGLGLVSTMEAEAWATAKVQGQGGAGMKNLARDHSDHDGLLLRKKFNRNFHKLPSNDWRRRRRNIAGKVDGFWGFRCW